MIILNTVVEQKVYSNTYKMIGNSFQYFDDEEEDKAKRLCDLANKYWKDVYLSSNTCVRCSLKHINIEGKNEW